MAYNPNVPAPTNRVQDDIAAMRDNFQHLAPLAQAVGELQTVSGLAQITNDLQTVSGLAQITNDLQTVSELAPYVQALLDSRIVEMGSNANGEYVRWENGLQVCFGWVVAVTGDGTSDPKGGTHTLPAGFASGAALLAGTESQSWVIYHNQSIVDEAVTTSFPWRAERKSGVWVSSYDYRFHFIAIGRWK